MSVPVLVTYATRYGSTREVAEAIAVTLRERDLEVIVQPAREVSTLERYGAVVLGAPLYVFRWHKDAHNFLSRHREALTQLPLAIFALGPLGTGDEERQGSREQLDKEMAKYPWLKPVTIELFVGKFDPAKLRFLDKILTLLPASPLHGVPASDARDWEAIRAWAGDLEAKLQPGR